MILVGTVHCDIEGPRRLEHLLYRIKPELISLEFPKGISEEEVRDLILSDRKETRKVVEQSELSEKFKQFMLEISDTRGYEQIVALDYCKHTGAKANFSDHPSVLVDYSYDGLRESLEEQTKGLDDKLAKISYEGFRKGVIEYLDRGYYDPKIFYEIAQSMPSKAQKGIIEGTKHLFRNGFAEEREQFMADQILATRPDLHIGGIAHIFGGYGKVVSLKPLYLRLDKVFQDRVRLCEESLE